VDVLIPSQIREAIAAHVVGELPNEACGLLAVDASGRIRFFYPTTNAERSAVAYTVEPREHFRALQHAERNGWEIGGVMHSHPGTAPEPSPTDIARAPDPDWLYLIARPDATAEPTVRAFHIREGSVTELALRIGPAT
jgi:proteasome lid subunit RPN8/RPN11